MIHVCILVLFKISSGLLLTRFSLVGNIYFITWNFMKRSAMVKEVSWFSSSIRVFFLKCENRPNLHSKTKLSPVFSDAKSPGLTGSFLVWNLPVNKRNLSVFFVDLLSNVCLGNQESIWDINIFSTKSSKLNSCAKLKCQRTLVFWCEVMRTGWKSRGLYLLQ